MIDNRQLTPHFSLFEMTTTELSQFQYENRTLTGDLVKAITATATLLEIVREIVNCPLIVLSGYRCADLNKAVGSGNASQHLLGQAADVSPSGRDIFLVFEELWKAVKEGKLYLGQLILETAQRDHPENTWIHVSLGIPWRPGEKDNQILRMLNGVYTILEGEPLDLIDA